MNQISLLGRLTAEPKIFTLDKDKKMATSTLAVGYDKSLEFIDIIAFEKHADLMKEYCIKGSMLGVVGRLQTKKFTDKQGIERKSTQVVVSSLTLTSSKKDQQEQTSQPVYTQPTDNDNSHDLQIDSDDLPF